MKLRSYLAAFSAMDQCPANLLCKPLDDFLFKKYHAIKHAQAHEEGWRCPWCGADPPVWCAEALAGFERAKARRAHHTSVDPALCGAILPLTERT